MKRALSSILAGVCLLLAFAAHAMWVSGGVKTNPSAGAILADTGSISGGGSTYTVIIAASVVTRCEIAVRDAANTSDVNVQTIVTVANGNVSFLMPMDVPPNGRVVVRIVSAITGIVHASILKDGAA